VYAVFNCFSVFIWTTPRKLRPGSKWEKITAGVVGFFLLPLFPFPVCLPFPFFFFLSLGSMTPGIRLESLRERRSRNRILCVLATTELPRCLSLCIRRNTRIVARQISRHNYQSTIIIRKLQQPCSDHQDIRRTTILYDVGYATDAFLYIRNSDNLWHDIPDAGIRKMSTAAHNHRRLPTLNSRYVDIRSEPDSYTRWSQWMGNSIRHNNSIKYLTLLWPWLWPTTLPNK